MFRRLAGLAIAMAFLALVTHVATATPLSVGDPAPRLTVAKFVKGAPVTRFEKGKLYVVEFWATWCGPCKILIPHLTTLQKKYKDVTFIGVSVLEQSQAAVQPFVQQMGAKMDYRVAMDSVPAGKDGGHGLMAVNWLEAARQNGIPTAFIVDKESRVAWIGHPMVMEGPLSKVVAGTWDTKREAVKMHQQQMVALKMQTLAGDLRVAYGAKNYPKVLTIVNELISSEPRLEGQVSYLKFTTLIKLNRTDEAASYGNKLTTGLLRHYPQGLNQLAWGIVDPAAKKSPAPLVEMALKAALRADQVAMGKDAAIADTLAAAYFASGKTPQAIETQERALKLAKGGPLEKEPSLAQHLARYRQGK